MKIFKAALVFCWLAGISTLFAESIRSEGVLGNSGADGKSLVKFGGMDFHQNGKDTGLAYDRLGGLWAFGGTGKLIRYSPDGRMLASYPLKDTKTSVRSLALADDLLLIRIETKLYRLPITAADGTEPSLLKGQALVFSLNSQAGKVSMVTPENKIGVYEPSTEIFTERGQWTDEKEKPNCTDLMPDDSIVVNGTWQYGKGGGKPEKVAVVLKGVHQVIGNQVYHFDGHMTLSKRNLKFEPDPGVVFGGSSGYFIGSLPEDGEMVVPRGMVYLGGTRYAVVGPVNIIHLLEWNVEKQSFESLRRIGAVHFSSSLALDNRGRVWFYSGFWDWNDGPDHVLRSATSFNWRDWDQAQAGVLPGGQLTFPFLFRAAPSIMYRPYDEDDKNTSSEVKGLPKNPTGLAVLVKGKESEVMVVDKDGKGLRIPMATNGKPRKGEGPVTLEMAGSKGAVTSLALDKDGNLIAADGGFVVFLKRDGNSFKESTRWNNWGTASKDKFGSEIYLDGSDGHLWVSDTANNRVLHFILEGEGSTSSSAYAGEGLETPLNAPKRIDAAGEKAVVMDSGNQRIVKLSLQK